MTESKNVYYVPYGATSGEEIVTYDISKAKNINEYNGRLIFEYDRGIHCELGKDRWYTNRVDALKMIKGYLTERVMQIESMRDRVCEEIERTLKGE